MDLSLLSISSHFRPSNTDILHSDLPLNYGEPFRPSPLNAFSRKKYAWDELHLLQEKRTNYIGQILSTNSSYYSFCLKWRF